MPDFSNQSMMGMDPEASDCSWVEAKTMSFPLDTRINASMFARRSPFGSSRWRTMFPAVGACIVSPMMPNSIV